MTQQQGGWTEAGVADGPAEAAAKPGGAGRGIAVGLAVVVVLCVIAGGIWYARADRPIGEVYPTEWMPDLTPERIESYLHPDGVSRWLPLPDVINARDIGGYAAYDGRTVRWNRVFRSGRLCELTEEGCGNFRALGIRTVVDLRNRVMIDSTQLDGDPACVQTVAEMWLHRFIPPRDKGTTPAEKTRNRVARNGESIAATLRLMSDEDNLPLLYHCTSGQERAGIVSWMLLELLGVDRRIIRAEYNLSGNIGEHTQYGGTNAVFEDIDAAGGIHRYLQAMGLSYDEQRRIRRHLLE